MTDDQARWLLLLGILVILPVGLYFRFRSDTGEKLDRWQEGLWILVGLGVLALVYLVGLIVFLIEPAWMGWSALPLPSVLRWLGVGIGICAGSLLRWSFRSLGPNLTDTVVTRNEAYLVTEGPYRWVRHPFYVAFALALIAITLITGNAMLAVTGLAIFRVLVARTSIEERKLIERFGREYEDYMRRTGRFVPRWRR